MQEEHAEYVRSMATLSAFMAGFVNIAFIQFDFEASEIPRGVLMGFGVTNALTVGFMPQYDVLHNFLSYSSGLIVPNQ